MGKALKEYGFTSYNNTIAPSSWTIPSHASIFTGAYPVIHGAHETKSKKLPYIKLKKQDTIITKYLKYELEYNTYLLTANPLVTPGTGFSDFDYVKEVEKPIFSILSEKDRGYLAQIRWDKGTENTLAAAKYLISSREFFLLLKFGIDYFFSILSNILAYLVRGWPKEKGSKAIKKEFERLISKNMNNEKIFIFINMIEVHEPYLVLEKLSFVDNFRGHGPDRRYIQKWREKYYKYSEYITKRLISMMEFMKKTGILDRSLVIITSDHGQLLGEDGRIGHGTFMDDELLSIPLFIRYPYKIKISKTKKDSWISLCRLYDLIFRFSTGHLESDYFLYSKTVFAESYGITRHVSVKSEVSNKKLERFEKYSIAIYHGAYKGIFDVEKWRFEKIISYDSTKKIDQEIEKMLKKEIIKFLRDSLRIKELAKL